MVEDLDVPDGSVPGCLDWTLAWRWERFAQMHDHVKIPACCHVVLDTCESRRFGAYMVSEDSNG
jgi:hypothetical protein